jgi:outer membrane immunogenic protein
MKKFLLTGVALSAFVAGPAVAADLPARATYKAPPQAELAFNWSGLYIGGHIGGGWGRTEITDHSLFGTILLIPTQRFDTSGFLGGVQAGWNYQVGRFVLGSEVDFSWSDVKGDQTSAFLGGIGSINRSSKADWMGTATVRLGYTPWDRVMIYSKVGAAWAHFDYTDTATILGTQVYSSTASETRSGWTVGSGFEWAFLPGWSVKAEYAYIDLGRRTVDFAPIGPVPVALDVDQRISQVKVGLNYRLGCLIDCGGVVAKY